MERLYRAIEVLAGAEQQAERMYENTARRILIWAGFKRPSFQSAPQSSPDDGEKEQ